MKFKNIYITIFIIILVGCNSSQQLAPSTSYAVRSASCFPVDGWSQQDQLFMDSLLTVAMDNEALYTVAASIKPMSTVAQTRIAIDSTGQQVHPAELAKMQRWHRAAEAFRCGDIEAALIPFRFSRNNERYLELVVFNKPRFRQMMEEFQPFWMKWGLTPDANPAVVATIIEYIDTPDRFRGYGYLFGYPDYAVDFFAEASESQKTTGIFVERDFFQIPAWSGERGRFVYAVPKGYTPTETDSMLYHRSLDVLNTYRSVRNNYMNSDSTIRAVELFRNELTTRKVQN